MPPPDRPGPPQRPETREIVELRRLKEEQPDLGSAVDLQIELLQLQKRIQARVPLPSIKLETEHLNSLLAGGPILQFEHLPIEWSDVRFLLRATAEAMRKHDALEDGHMQRIDALCRDASKLPPVMRSWYEATRPGAAVIDPDGAGLEVILQQAMRPVLIRYLPSRLASDVIRVRSSFRQNGHEIW